MRVPEKVPVQQPLVWGNATGRQAAKRLHAPRFQGESDDLVLGIHKNHQKLLRSEELRLDRLRRETLENPILQLQDRVLTGQELLTLVQELSETQPIDVNHKKFMLGIALLGIPLCFKSYRDGLQIQSKPFLNHSKLAELLYGPGNYDRDSSVKAALMKLNSSGLVHYVPFSFTQWTLTPLGEQVLQKKLTPQTKNILPAQELRRESLKLLITNNSAGFSGWDLLQRIDGLLNTNRNFLMRLFSTGMTEQKMISRLGMGDIPAAQSQFKALVGLGLLQPLNKPRSVEEHLHPAKTLWVLTEKGRAALSAGDPLKAGLITGEDLMQIFETEIQRLQELKTHQETRLKKAESLYAKAMEDLEKQRTRLEGLEKKALEEYEQVQACQSFEAKLGLEKKAAETALEAELLQQEIQEEADALKAHLLNLQQSKSALQQWGQRNHQRIKELTAAYIKIKTGQISLHIQDLTKGFRIADGAQETEDDTAKMLLSILNMTLGGEGDARQTEETDMALRANASIQHSLLEETIANIRARQQSPQIPQSEDLRVEDDDATMEALKQEAAPPTQAHQAQSPPKKQA